MVASKFTDVINADVAHNPSSPALGCSSSVPCSICFDLVIDDGERSIAKLHCGHKFHLDCIGSAFNVKGAMQCPNCRKVENGRWLFADGSAHAISETGEQGWMPYEGPHDLSYSRGPFGFHWCPFGGFPVHSSIEEAVSSLNTFANFIGNHAIITEHTAAPSSARSSISHFRPSEHVGNPNFHHPLNAVPAPRNNIRSTTNIQHPSWGWNCHFLPYNAERDFIDHGNPTTPRFPHTRARAQADAVARSPSFLQPLHYTQQTRESSVANSQLRERNQIHHTTYHQEQPSEITSMPSSTNGFRISGRIRALPMILPVVPGQPHHHHHHGGHGFYIPDTERDESSYVPIIRGPIHHQFSRGPDSTNHVHWS